MQLKERILAHRNFPCQPADLSSRVSSHGYEVETPLGAEVWLDENNGHWTFYIDADRNPTQLTTPNLIIRGAGTLPDDAARAAILQAKYYGYSAASI